MTVPRLIAQAQERIDYWSSRTGATARRWLTYWSDKLAYLKGIYTRPAPPSAPSVAPTAPGTPSASLSTLTVTLTWTAGSATAPASVSYYNVYRSTGGAYSLLKTAVGLTTTDSLPVSTSASYKVSTVDTTGQESSLSAASGTVTTSGSPLADTTAPTVPDQPTVVSGGGASTDYSVSVPTVSDTVVGGADTSGMTGGNYKFYSDGSLVATRPHPSISGSYTAYGIGGATGSDAAGSLSAANDGEHYGTSDAFYLKAKDTTGDATADFTITSITPNSGQVWVKGGVEFRASSAAGSAYVNIFVASNTGSGNLLNVEQRTLANGSATQGTAIAATLPIRVRIVRSHNSYACQYATNPASPSWVTFSTVSVDLGDTPISGYFANKCSWAYTSNSHAASSTVVCNGSGSVGSTISVTCKATDLAGNQSSASTGRSITFNSVSSSSDFGTGAYVIGCNPRYTASGVDTTTTIRMSKNAVDVLGCYGGWESYNGCTRKALFDDVKGRNANWKGYAYFDFTYINNNMSSAVSTYKWYMQNDDGTPVYDNIGFGSHLVGNMASPSGLLGDGYDIHGRSYAQAAGDYAVDAAKNGGAGGDSAEGFSANSSNDGIFIDDVFGNPWRAGLYTPGNSGATSALQAGYAALFNRIRSNGQLVAFNTSQFSSSMPSAYQGLADVAVMEAIGSLIASPSSLLSAYTNQRLALKSGGKALFVHYDLNNDEALCLQGACAAAILGAELYAPQNGSGTSPLWDSYFASSPWFDWFDIDTGTRTGKSYGSSGVSFNYAGTSVDSGQTSAWSNGVWRRRFSNCWFLWNPYGNGTQTVSLGTTLYKPTSATMSTMNGGAVSSITMAPYTGMILLV